MTDSEDVVSRIVGSGAPVPSPDEPEQVGDFEYDQVHEFLAQMDAPQDAPPGSAPHAPSPE